MLRMLMIDLQIVVGLAIAAVFGVGFYHLWDWLAPSEGEAPPATRSGPGDPPADHASDLFSLCDALARRRGLLRWP